MTRSGLVKLRQRFGAALGAVAAFGRSHDHADLRRCAGLGNPLVVGHDENARDALHPPRRLDAALDERLGRAARAFQLDQRLSRIARRRIARRDQDDGVHRDGGQSWMWRTPTGFLAVDHEQSRDLVFLEERQSIVDKSIRGDRLGIARHELGRAVIQTLLDMPPQVAVGDRTDEIAGIIDHPDDPQPFCRHLDDGLMHRSVFACQRHRVARMHEPAHRLQPRAERSARVEAAEIAPGEALLAHDRHRQRVAKREGHGGRGRRRHQFRSDLRPMRKHQRRRRCFAEHRTAIAGDRDHRDSDVPEMVDHGLKLGRFAALRDEDRNVAARSPFQGRRGSLLRGEGRSPSSQSRRRSPQSCARHDPTCRAR